MVAAVRRGQSLHQVAARFRVSPATVLRWVRRAHGRRLDRVDWSDRPRAPRRTRRCAAALEDLILDIRRHLREQSDLGFYGAAAVLDELARRHGGPLPSARTVNRILERRGAF